MNCGADDPATWSAILRVEDAVIKIGGNALVPRTTGALDVGVVEGLGQWLLQRSEAGARSVVISGGLGGHLFLDWARDAGASDAIQNSVGSALLDISATVLRSHLGQLLGDVVCPRVPADIDALVMYTHNYPIVVAGAVAKGAITSDSQAALVAQSLRWRPIFIKRSLPFLHHSRRNAPDACHEALWTEIADEVSISAEQSRPGWHPSLDVVCMNTFRRDKVRLTIVSSELLMNRPLNLQSRPHLVLTVG